MLTVAWKWWVKRDMESVLMRYCPEETQEFNRGVDEIVGKCRWVRYPSVNVVLEVGEGDWAEWLEMHCKILGLGEVRNGRPAVREW